MQFSGDGVYKYIGSNKGRNGDRDFYSVTLADHEGTVIRLYTDAETFGKVSVMSFGDDVTPVIRMYQSKNGGVGASLVDFIGPSRG